MLRECADREVADDLERALVDHVDRVAVAVRHVDVRARVADDGAEVPDAIRRVDVLLVHERRNARERERSGRRANRAARAKLDDARHRARCRSAAGDENAGRRSDRHEVGQGLPERARDDDLTLRDVDADDPIGRRADGRAAPTDDVGDRPERRGRRVRRRRRETADPEDAARGGHVFVDGIGGDAGGSEPPAMISLPPTAVTAA